MSMSGTPANRRQLMGSAELLERPVLRHVAEGVSVRRFGELQVVVIQHPVGRAAIALQGAHVLTWTPAGEPDPVIWLSPRSAMQEGVAIRGGVPVCWPWFCDMGDGQGEGKPWHGFARIQPWELADVAVADRGVDVRLALCDSPVTRAIWDHPFRLSLHVSLGVARLRVRLGVEGDFATTAALHSYLHVGDITHASVHGTGLDYTDTVNGTAARLEQEPLCIDREFGGIFQAPLPLTRLADAALGRHVLVEHGGNSNVVVWNPWIERSRAMADLPDDGYRNFLCIESACVDGLLRCSPGNPALLEASYSVSREETADGRLPCRLASPFAGPP